MHFKDGKSEDKLKKLEITPCEERENVSAKKPIHRINLYLYFHWNNFQSCADYTEMIRERKPLPAIFPTHW